MTVAAVLEPLVGSTQAANEELKLASQPIDGGAYRTVLSVPDMHCAGCMRRVEGTLSALEGVTTARVNLTTKRVAVTWKGESVPPLQTALADAGYPAHILDAGTGSDDVQLRRLILATAVAGFAAANIMLLSVSIWSGADAATRELFHWISALIALPALAYSGRPFFLSAWNALRRRTTNMDVPISVGVALAFGLSLYETVTGGEHAFFDASVTLLFFLLIGRTLDHMMREKARTAIVGLMRLSPRGANVVGANGRTAFVPVAEVNVGATIHVSAGDRIPLDGDVVDGMSDLDASIVTGESAYQPAGPGSAVLAGMLNVSGPLTVRVTARSEGSFLAEMVRLMEAAEGSRARYRRLADRVAKYYSPVVHLAALATTFGWVFATGDWHRAISVGIAVLIITCPCALGLAVPIVQVVGARRLFEKGIMLKDGSAIERLTEVDTVVLDKTGTLTVGFEVSNGTEISQSALALAAALAGHSMHPVAQAIVRAADKIDGTTFSSVREVPGAGLEAEGPEGTYRLGRAGWALPAGVDASGPVLSLDGRELARFLLTGRLREDGLATIRRLKKQGLAVNILSGDSPAAVAAVAGELEIDEWHAAVRPADKVAHLDVLRAAGHKVLMIGDGLNDGAALAAAHVSMAPGNAVDIGRNAADLVFLRESLVAVTDAFKVAWRADQLTRQNLALAIGYNVLAVPVAVFGFVTPLVAALAMSISSILVVGNALRLTRGSGRQIRSAKASGVRQVSA
jgi:Cu2+-exporting ATPase